MDRIKHVKQALLDALHDIEIAEAIGRDIANQQAREEIELPTDAERALNDASRAAESAAVAAARAARELSRASKPW